MPRVDGCEATRRLRAAADFPQVPILALTAMVGSQDMAMGAGCDAYLNKPIEIPALLSTIRSWLEKGRPSPAPSTGEWGFPPSGLAKKASASR